MPRHTGGMPRHRAVATGCRSLGSAWRTGSRSGRRIARALRSRVGAIEARLAVLVKLLLKRQKGGRDPALLGLMLVLLVVHSVPSVSGELATPRGLSP